MSNLYDWSNKQIEGLDVSDEKKGQYKTIIDAFAKQDHSGSSAGYALSYINRYVENGYEDVKNRLDGMLNKMTESDGRDMQELITKDILEIIDFFRKYEMGKDEASKISRLMNWKPLTPLTGEDDEWGEPETYKEGKSTQQNKVCSTVFRDNYDNKTTRYIGGRVYSENGGHTWFTGNHHNGIVESSIPVTFPFWVPDKPEYVYLNGEDSEEIITDKDRIKELYDEFSKKFAEQE